MAGQNGAVNTYVPKIFERDKYAVKLEETNFYMAFATFQYELKNSLDFQCVFQEVVLQTQARQILDVKVVNPLLSKTNSTQVDINIILELFRLFQDDPSAFVGFLNILCNLNDFPNQSEKFRNIIETNFPGTVFEVHGTKSKGSVTYKTPTTCALASANSLPQHDVVDETMRTCNFHSTGSLSYHEQKTQVTNDELYDQSMETEPLDESLHQPENRDVEAVEKKLRSMPKKRKKRKIEKENEPKKKGTSRFRRLAKQCSACVLGCVCITAVGTAAYLHLSNRQTRNTSISTGSNYASNSSNYIWQATTPASYFRASDIDIHVQQVQNGLKKYSFTPKNSSRFGKPYSRI